MISESGEKDEFYLVDTSSLPTGEGRAKIYLGLNLLNGKIVHTEIGSIDDETHYLRFIQNLAQEAGFIGRERRITLVLNLEPGNEDNLLAIFPFLREVVCNIQLCRQYSDPVWEYIFHQIKKET